MQTVQELLDDAIQYDAPLLAHALFSGLQDGILKPTDDADAIDYLRLDLDAVVDLNKRNLLGIRIVKLFGVPTDPATKSFAFILAYDEKSAAAAFNAHYKQPASRVVDATSKMDTSIYFEETNQHKSFWEIRKETQKFPRFVCEVGK